MKSMSDRDKTSWYMMGKRDAWQKVVLSNFKLGQWLRNIHFIIIWFYYIIFSLGLGSNRKMWVLLGWNIS